MLHNVLPIIASELNEYLKSRFNTSEDRVLLSNVLEQDGSLALKEINRVVCCLLNLREDRTVKATKSMRAGSGGYYQGGGEIQLMMDIAFIAHFKNTLYTDALKFLSGTVYFFQEKSVFTNSNTPSLSSNIDKLSFEIKSLEVNELQSVVSLLGIKHTPMVVYTARLLTFNSDNIDDTIPFTTGVTLDPETDS